MCFSPYLSVGGALPRGQYTTCLSNFLMMGSSKFEVYKTYFFDIVTTHNDHLGYLKHVLGIRFYVGFFNYGR